MSTQQNQLICQIGMAWPSRDEKLSIRIEKGTKPRLKTLPDGNTILAVVPSDTFVNWPPVKAEMPGGYFVTIQRLQQQYKISVQHNHERKAEMVIYSSTFAHENDIKTQVKEMNTQIEQVGISGPNLDVQGILRARRLTLEATVGTMHVNAKIQTERLALHAQSIVIATEALISTHKIRTICRKMQLDGRIYPSEAECETRHLCAILDSGLVHLGVDGSIGESNEKENNRQNRARSQGVQITADTLSLRISGSLANYGRIVANERIDLQLGDSLLSLSDGTLDSAGRGYGALKQIRGVASTPDCAPSSSSLHQAISEQNTAAAAHLIENGVDLKDRVRSKHQTLRQAAIQKYRQKKEETKLNKDRANITLINALFTVHDWRRGSIAANIVCATIGKNCDDCAQFSSKELQLKIGGNGKVEMDSIWHCTWVEMDAVGGITICGQVKHRTLILNSGDYLKVTRDAIINHEIFARVNCKSFHCDGIWSIGENFVIDVKESASFGGNSYIESEKLELVGGGDCVVDGSWQTGTAWCSVGANFTIACTGKVFVDESATLGAAGLLCHGFCNVTETFDIQLKESAHFFTNSKLECHRLNMICEEHCTVGGTWIVDNMQVYVRQDLITTSTGKAAAFSKATVTTGAFRNDALWQMEKDMSLTVGTMEQSEDGTLLVKQSLEATIHSESIGAWAGRIICSRLQISCLKMCQYDGFLRANEAEVLLAYPGESQLVATGQWDVLAGPLTIKGNSCLVPPTPRHRHPFPAFILSGRLSATAIVAPFAAVEIASDAVARLAGIVSPNPDVDFNILVSAGALTTEKGATVVSLSKDAKAEGIICASTWYHEGQIRFIAENVHLLANSWVNKGRITNTENKQNHVKNCYVVVDEVLLNHGTLACDILVVVGEGILDNRGRIFAVQNMDIRLNNFHNDEGLMESKNNMRLLSASKEWTRLGGSIKAKKTIDLCAHKLEFAVKDATSLSRGDRLSFSARMDLILGTAIADENKRLALGCAAQRSVTIDAPMEIDRMEVMLGSASSSEPVLLHLREPADVIVNSLVVSGGGKELRIVLDGSLRCSRINIAATFERVVVSGRGTIEINVLQAENSLVYFDICQIISVNEISARLVEVVKDSLLPVRPCGESDATTIICEEIVVNGTVFVEGKLFIASKKGCDLSISGPIIGSSANSEVSVEATKLRIDGQMANLKFLELFAKESLHMKNIKLKNIVGVAVECGELQLSGELISCDNAVFNSDVAVVGGSCHSTAGSAAYSLFATTVTCSVDFQNYEKINIGCRRTAVVSGSFSQVKCVDLDAKWLACSASFADCGSVSCTAWSMQVRGGQHADDVKLTGLGVILCSADISAPTIRVVAPFVLSLTTVLPSHTEVHALALLSLAGGCPAKGATFLSIDFEESLQSSSLSHSESAAWKETAILMKDRFNCSSVDVDEMLLGLKYLSDLTPTRLHLDTDCAMYKDLTKLCAKFDQSPINVFNLAKLVGIIHGGRTQFAVTNTPERTSSKKKRKTEVCLLYDCLSTFRSAKYGREPRGSSDTDGGYASRSSSEDLDIKDTNRPSSSLARHVHSPLFDHNHFDEIDRKLDESINNESVIEHFNDSCIGEEELAEFEELEQEIEESEKGIVRTDYIVCRDQRIQLARLKQKTSSCLSPRPKAQFPITRAPSSNDLAMKRLKIKNALSTMDLRSFGSESSLISLDFSTAPDIGSPMQFSASPLQRSRIPRGSFRSPRKLQV